MPIPLFVAGKLMKLPIRYSQAIWITLFAGFVGGLATMAHILVGLAVFLGILYYELDRTFHPRPQQTIIIILIDIAIVIGLEFVKPYLLLGGLSLM
jgi:hypothetical protein